MKKFVNWFFIVVVLFTSCIPLKKLEYVQGPQSSFDIKTQEPQKIRIDDELYINVTSYDDVQYNLFSQQGEYRSTYGDEVSLSLITYTVDKSGYIFFPMIGDVYVKDLTLNEAREKLIELLGPYLDQSTVIVKFAYKKITILGAVNNPGSYNYSKSTLNIFEALGYASDLTLHGNRREIVLMRNINNKIEKYELDLTKEKIFASDLFLLKPDDIIYVKTRYSGTWGTIGSPLNLVVSTITSAITSTILILNFDQNN